MAKAMVDLVKMMERDGILSKKEFVAEKEGLAKQARERQVQPAAATHRARHPVAAWAHSRSRTSRWLWTSATPAAARGRRSVSVAAARAAYVPPATHTTSTHTRSPSPLNAHDPTHTRAPEHGPTVPWSARGSRPGVSVL